MIEPEHPVDRREPSVLPGQHDDEHEFESQVRDKSASATRMALKRQRMRVAAETSHSEDRSRSEPDDRAELKTRSPEEPLGSRRLRTDDRWDNELERRLCDQLASSSAPSPSSPDVINMKRISDRKALNTYTNSARFAATLFLLALGLVLPSQPPPRASTTRSNTQNCHRPRAATCDSHRSGIVLLASAEGAPEIGSLRTYWRRHQQVSHTSPPPPAQQPALPLNAEPTMKPNKTPIPIYTLKPEAHLRIQEGSRYALRCATKRRMEHNYWTKDGEILFNLDMSKADVKAKRFSFIGDVNQNDYSIELKDAKVEDSGVYQCHTTTTLSNGDNDYDFLVGSNVTVVPAPESDLAAHPESSTQQHSQRSTVIAHATVPQSFQSDSALQTFSLVQPPASHTLTRLPPPTRLLSNRSTSTASSQAIGLTMPIVWPYILLALAAILMLTNVYFIYSLVRRHTRRRRSDVDEVSNRMPHIDYK